MKKFITSLILAAALSGCGGGDGTVGAPTTTFDFENANGNFITTTVDVENRFFYILNRTDNNVSGLYAVTGEDDHHHARAVLPQEAEEEGLELETLDGTPFLFGATQLVDLAVEPSGQFFFILDSTGTIRSYEINGLRGFLDLVASVPTGVTNPRRIAVSPDARGVAVLGDSVSIHAVASDGAIDATGSTEPNTQTWTDLDIQGRNGVAATPAGVLGFQWAPGAALFPQFPIALPGATRGETLYIGSTVYVANTADQTVSQLTQSGTSDLTLQQTFALPANLTAPVLLEAIEDGSELVVADTDTLSRFTIEAAALTEGATATLTRAPNRLFAPPEQEVLLVGHNTGAGTTQVILHEGELEVSPDPGPGGNGAFGFGFAERDETFTQTVNL